MSRPHSSATPLQPPYRLEAHEPAGPFIIAVPEDLVARATHVLSLPGANEEIEQLIR